MWKITTWSNKIIRRNNRKKIQKLHNAIIQLNSVDEKYLNQNSTRFLDFEDYIKRKYYKNDNSDPKEVAFRLFKSKKEEKLRKEFENSYDNNEDFAILTQPYEYNSEDDDENNENSDNESKENEEQLLIEAKLRQMKKRKLNK